jgi:hypothetical protein
MGNNYVRFWDSVDIIPVDNDKDVKDLYPGMMSGTQTRPLRVRIAATHAGRITRNNGLYLPHKMRDAVPSWTTPFPKPIQVHHNSDQDPIGRVVAARYVDLSQGVRALLATQNGLKDGVSSLTWLDKLIEGSLSKDELIETVREHILKDTHFTEDPNYEGLGYIELIADITDPDSIQKVLDKRYLTGSTGSTTNSAVCSMCKQDWAEKGRCDHEPGKMYDGVKCVLIAGDLLYDEFSLVNKPADPKSMIIEISVNGITDSVTINSEEEQKMLFKEAFLLVSENEKYKVLDKLEDKVKQIVDSNKDLTEEKLIELLDQQLPSPVVVIEPVVTPVVDSVVVDPNDPKVILGDQYDELVGDDSWGTEYAKMIAECISGQLKDEDGSSLESIKDAKLSSEQRKKMSSSTFCGPNRSYPVNDCGHAKSAMAYAKKYNESSSVMACIRRKAARLGCPFSDGKKSDSVQDFGQFVLDYFDSFSDEELSQMNLGLQASMKERNLNCGCDSLVNEKKVQELESLYQSKEKELKEISDKLVSELKQRISEDEKRLESARNENKYLQGDIDNLMDSLASSTLQVREAHLSRVVDLSILNGVKKTKEEISTELKDKGLTEVKTVLDELVHKVDIQKISDTLSSGLTNRNPTGEIVDPTVVIDNLTKKTPENLLKLDEGLRLKVLQIQTKYGPAAAEKFIQDHVAALNKGSDSVKE